MLFGVVLHLLFLSVVECLSRKDLNLPTSHSNRHGKPLILQDASYTNENGAYTAAWVYEIYYNNNDCGGYQEGITAVSSSSCIPADVFGSSTNSFRVLVDLSSPNCDYVQQYFEDDDCTGEPFETSPTNQPLALQNKCAIINDQFSLIYYCQASFTTPSQYLQYPYVSSVLSTDTDCGAPAVAEAGKCLALALTC